MTEHSPIYFQVADDLESLIIAGKYLPREKLPSKMNWWKNIRSQQG